MVDLALSVFYACDDVVSVGKGQLEPATWIVFLGLVCDTDACRLEVP